MYISQCPAVRKLEFAQVVATCICMTMEADSLFNELYYFSFYNGGLVSLSEVLLYMSLNTIAPRYHVEYLVQSAH